MPEDYDSILIDHVMATLPDKISDRRRLLNALCLKTPQDHPQAATVASVLDHLDQHILAQREFPFGGGGK